MGHVLRLHPVTLMAWICQGINSKTTLFSDMASCTDCDGCGNNFSVTHALLCHKGVLVLERHSDAAKEWRALSARALNSSCISYEPKINSRTVQGKRNGAVA